MAEDIRKLQEKALEILDYFDGFCQEHKLIYFVIGGCCIGSQRYKGFIPWDDDIDVFMPREDYEKLTSLWPSHGDSKNYCLCRTTEDINYHSIVSLLKDNNTTFINSHSVCDDIHHGYMMDIIPIDGYAPTKLKRFFQVIHASIFSLFNAQRLPDNQGGAVRLMTRLLLAVLPSKKLRYKLWSHSEKKMSQYPISKSDYVSELATGFKYMKLKYPKEIFEKQLWVDFEGRKIPIPQGYDLYLTMAFGDYMVEPPLDKRVPKHKTVFTDMNTSYKAYKGIWYLNDECR